MEEFSIIIDNWGPIVTVISIVASWVGMGWRIKTLEDRITKLETNHLPHIQASLDRMSEQLTCLTASVAKIEGRLEGR